MPFLLLSIACHTTPCHTTVHKVSFHQPSHAVQLSHCPEKEWANPHTRGPLNSLIVLAEEGQVLIVVSLPKLFLVVQQNLSFLTSSISSSTRLMAQLPSAAHTWLGVFGSGLRPSIHGCTLGWLSSDISLLPFQPHWVQSGGCGWSQPWLDSWCRVFCEFSYKDPSFTSVSPNGYSHAQKFSPSVLLILGQVYQLVRVHLVFFFFLSNREVLSCKECLMAAKLWKKLTMQWVGSIQDLTQSWRWRGKMKNKQEFMWNPLVAPAMAVSIINPETWTLLTHT